MLQPSEIHLVPTSLEGTAYYFSGFLLAGNMPSKGSGQQPELILSYGRLYSSNFAQMPISFSPRNLINHFKQSYNFYWKIPNLAVRHILIRTKLQLGNMKKIHYQLQAMKSLNCSLCINEKTSPTEMFWRPCSQKCSHTTESNEHNMKMRNSHNGRVQLCEWSGITMCVRFFFLIGAHVSEEWRAPQISSRLQLLTIS